MLKYIIILILLIFPLPIVLMYSRVLIVPLVIFIVVFVYIAISDSIKKKEEVKRRNSEHDKKINDLKEAYSEDTIEELINRRDNTLWEFQSHVKTRPYISIDNSNALERREHEDNIKYHSAIKACQSILDERRKELNNVYTYYDNPEYEKLFATKLGKKEENFEKLKNSEKAKHTIRKYYESKDNRKVESTVTKELLSRIWRENNAFMFQLTRLLIYIRY